MATASVEICNLALLHVGVKNPIETLDEDSVEAIACNTLYGPMRDVALASWWWSFATGRATLAQLDDAERDGWGYAFAVPSDCLQPRYIYAGSRFPESSFEIPYVIEASEDGDSSVLLTDHDAPSLVYTRRVLNVANYPPLFVNALAWLLAANLVVPLKLRADLEQFAMQRYEREVAKAAASDKNASHDLRPVSTYVRARR